MGAAVLAQVARSRRSEPLLDERSFNKALTIPFSDADRKTYFHLSEPNQITHIPFLMLVELLMFIFQSNYSDTALFT